MLALGSVSESQAPALKITFGLRAREEVLKKSDKRLLSDYSMRLC